MSIKLHNISKKYDAKVKKIIALDGINLSFKDGEFVAVMGESGSGKTTLLNTLCGLEIPDSGEIYFNETNFTALSKNEQAVLRRSKIGVIYQFYNLIPELSIKDNITLPSELDGKAEDTAYLSEILDTVGLNGRENDFPSSLSGGQQQRAAIARALYQRPSLILADEPTGNLDEKNGEEILSLLLRESKERKITVITATHSRAVAECAERVITLSSGSVISDIKQPRREK